MFERGDWAGWGGGIGRGVECWGGGVALLFGGTFIIIVGNFMAGCGFRLGSFIYSAFFDQL